MIDYILGAIALGIVFLLGCTGEIITEKAGHLNLGIPGIMCVGGASGCLALKFCNGLPSTLLIIISVLATFVGGAIMGAIYCFLTVTLKANQNVTGLAMTIFGVGTAKYIMFGMTTTAYPSYLYALKYFRITIPFLSKIPPSFTYYGVLLWLAIIIAIVAAFVLSKTKVGLNLRAIGESPATADAAGINVTAYKYIAICVGSSIAGLGGFYYIIDYMGSTEAYKTIESLGWLSVALVIFTLWRPMISIFGSMIFGLLYLAGTRIPPIMDEKLGIKLDLSVTTLLQEVLPYLVTIIVLIITSTSKKRENQPPASLGIPYFREER